MAHLASQLWEPIIPYEVPDVTGLVATEGPAEANVVRVAAIAMQTSNVMYPLKYELPLKSIIPVIPVVNGVLQNLWEHIISKGETLENLFDFTQYQY